MEKREIFSRGKGSYGVVDKLEKIRVGKNLANEPRLVGWGVKGGISQGKMRSVALRNVSVTAKKSGGGRMKKMASTTLWRISRKTFEEGQKVSD